MREGARTMTRGEAVIQRTKVTRMSIVQRPGQRVESGLKRETQKVLELEEGHAHVELCALLDSALQFIEGIRFTLAVRQAR